MKKKNSIMIITFVVCFIFMISACSIKKDGIKPSVTESESHSETTAHSETRATNVNISYIGKKVTTKDGLGITITSINRGDNLAGQDKPASGYEFLSVTFSLKNGGEAHSNMIPYQFHLIFADQLGTQISPTYFPDDTPLKNYHVILPFEEVKDIKLVYEVPIGMVNLLFSYVDYSKTPIFIIPLMAASVEDLVFYGLENDSSNKYVLVQSLQSSLSLILQRKTFM